jgi:flagellar motor switch protein FliN/FliY
MEIGNLIDSEIMQLLPISFSKELVTNLLNMDVSGPAASTPELKAQKAAPPSQPQPKPAQPSVEAPQMTSNDMYGAMDADAGYSRSYEAPRQREHVNVQPAQFQSFDDSRIMIEKKNISLIMDVPLQVTVELGRTHKLIREILEFGPGSIIELDKLAGEPVDIMVNGKAIAKGEVVVIDESFGVRITDIIHPSKRL